MNVNGGKEAQKFLFHWCREVGYDSDICASGVEGRILELCALNTQIAAASTQVLIRASFSSTFTPELFHSVLLWWNPTECTANTLMLFYTISNLFQEHYNLCVYNSWLAFPIITTQFELGAKIPHTSYSALQKATTFNYDFVLACVHQFYPAAAVTRLCRFSGTASGCYSPKMLFTSIDGHQLISFSMLAAKSHPWMQVVGSHRENQALVGVIQTVSVLGL